MLEQLGLFMMASMAVATPQTSSIRLNLVAVVPVTCSSAVVLASQQTSGGIRINLGGSCNANHLVRVTMPETMAQNAVAQLNGLPGIKEAQSFVFHRPGYFQGSSVLNIKLNGDAEAGPSSTNLVFEISAE